MSGALSPATTERDVAAGGRRGSRFSDKQIAHAVKNRKAVEIISASGEHLVTGFVYGMDDYTIGIVDPRTGLSVLIHKSAAAVIRFVDSPGYPESPGALGDICEPFRKRVMRDHFNETVTSQ